MELKVFQDTLPAVGGVWEAKAELPIETELLIPDYQPQVFKIVKCFVTPVVLQKQVTPGRLAVEGYLRCVVFYQAEEDQSLCQAEQKLPFSRALDLPQGEFSACAVTVGGEVEYLNCRAVNQRRVDVRGAFALTAQVCAQKEEEIVTALAGAGAEQKLTDLAALRTVARVDKLITAEEAFSLPQTPLAVLDVTGVGEVDEVKLVTGKAVVRGRVQVTVTWRSAPGYALESARQMVPFDQILDLENAGEGCTAFAEVEMIGASLSAGGEGAGSLSVSALLHLRLVRPTQVSAVADAFSTQYDAQVEYKTVECEELAQVLENTAEGASSGALPDENARLIGCLVDLRPPEPAAAEGGVRLAGRGTAHLLCLNSLGEIDCYDKLFDYALPDIWPGAPQDYRAECWAAALEAEPAAGAGEASVRVNVRVRGLLFRRRQSRVVGSIACEQKLESPDPEVALRVYYAAEGEEIFAIAKRYHVPPAQLLALNHLEDLPLAAPARLLIPMTL